MTTYKELLSQRADLDKKIAQAQKKELSNVVAQVRGLIKEYGLSPSQCGFGKASVAKADKPVKKTKTRKTSKARPPVKPKYITPDGKKTWAGRGKMPREFQALVSAGRSINEFLIK
jgi:DNA-binding protein H-NS